ncbi:hypothetical protein L1987_54698 [Smallanthus sonchifolius]|uniref:Uncharacterized protein n=1 Tax=Smallanthus sonchifolius TaxID=185202 RepID=A0ACB9E7Y2_9ASTR|nr:hypothetical protein L1987_54698 [Smallanthus sonchifolius]
MFTSSYTYILLVPTLIDNKFLYNALHIIVRACIVVSLRFIWTKMASTACFMIISRNDIPIYEAEVGTAPKKEEAAHQHQFILHAALDVVQDLAWTTSAMKDS